MIGFIGYGLVAAAGWGTGDFLSDRAGRKTNPKNEKEKKKKKNSMKAIWVVYLEDSLLALTNFQQSFVISDGVILPLPNILLIGQSATLLKSMVYPPNGFFPAISFYHL
ncbi:hypothetical protein HY572_03545 [Candidatus Micrarchaeota archaeon]|nr:hypothetical protein [Candidatus Micrarchaeota archaeon]